MTTPQVTIKYRTEYGVQPTDIVIDVSTPLTSEQLPTLEAENYKFLGWVHINSNGHESELSERMIVSENWLIPNGLNNQYYVVFTAKWKNDKKSEDTPVVPVADESVKYTKQTLDAAQKQQARENIGVYSMEEVDALIPEIPEIPDIPDIPEVPTVQELALAIYPVGSIYISVNSTNPSTLFGGTWERLKDRFLLGAGDTYSNGATGGEASHTLTVDEMPTHDHDVRTTRSESYPAYWHSNHTGNTNSSSGWAYLSTAGSNNGGVGTLYVEEVGGGAAHNNMPPYLAVYMWKRTA